MTYSKMAWHSSKDKGVPSKKALGVHTDESRRLGKIINETRGRGREIERDKNSVTIALSTGKKWRRLAG